MAMAITEKDTILVRMSDSSLTFVDSAQDIRGRKALDRDGEEVGSVEDLFVDQNEQKIRFLEISSGGFLGLGETKFLVPVDAITGVEEEIVRIDQTRKHIANAPSYKLELVDTRFLTNIYDYYGYAPYWGADYNYPPFPYYPPIS